MNEATDLFVGLTPDRALDAIEATGLRCGAVCNALNSFENRVYEIALRATGDDGGRGGRDERPAIAKFYRPGRWSEAQIREEHAMLRALTGAEVPVCDVVELPNGDTLAEVGHIRFALFSFCGGRAPEDIDEPLAHRMGSLAARMHNVGQTLGIQHRLPLTADRLDDCLDELLDRDVIPAHIAPAYEEAGREIAAVLDERLDGVAPIAVHGDLHVSNLLLRGEVLHLLDFDDMVIGPPMQDLWLLLPSRDHESKRLRLRFLQGYEQFRDFDRSTLNLLEPLRGFRYITYALWLAKRWHDPIFPLTWPHFGTETYWSNAARDLEDVLAHADAPVLMTEQEVLAEDDDEPYFFDL